MSVTTETSSVEFAGDDVQTTFPTGFKILTNDDLLVSIGDTGETPVALTRGVHYTVSGAGEESGATVFLVGALAIGSTLLIEREVPFVQATSFREAGAFSPASHEDALDYLCFQTQQLDRRTAVVESQSVLGDTVIGNGLYMDGDTLHVGAGAGITVAADDISVAFGGAPLDVNRTVASAGASSLAAREDHKHDIATDTPVAGAVVAGGAAAAGAAVTLARSDHIHAVLTDAPVAVSKSANAAGVATTFARSDHKHDVSTDDPVSIADANAEGVATTLARSDHVHDHGAQTIGTGNQHAVATNLLAGFMSAADKLKLDNTGGTFAGTVQTTSATPANVVVREVEDLKCEMIEVVISAMRSTLAEAAGYKIAGTFRRSGGTLTQVGTTTALVTHEDAAAWAVAFVVLGTQVQVQVTGAAASTIDWRARGRYVTAP